MKDYRIYGRESHIHNRSLRFTTLFLFATRGDGGGREKHQRDFFHSFVF